MSRLPSTCSALVPTCSIPIAVQFIPIAWRHRSRRFTSWEIVPSVSMRKCAHTPGFSPRWVPLFAKWFHALSNEVPDV